MYSAFTLCSAIHVLISSTCGGILMCRPHLTTVDINLHQWDFFLNEIFQPSLRTSASQRKPHCTFQYIAMHHNWMNPVQNVHMKSNDCNIEPLVVYCQCIAVCHVLSLFFSPPLAERAVCWWVRWLRVEGDWFWICEVVSSGERQCPPADPLLYPAVRRAWALPQLGIWPGVRPLEPGGDLGRCECLCVYEWSTVLDCSAICIVLVRGDFSVGNVTFKSYVTFSIYSI